MGIYGRKTIAMKHFFAGIGEIHFLLFLLYLSMSASLIIGLVIGYTKINLINSIIIIALGMILALILVLSRVYRKYFYRDDDD
ncbi:putative bacteriocin [Streptococcus pneumoniae]|nr:putative bacteriocin [Streptococcus pneumoniae]